jgi:hypothetical protein
MLYIDFGGFTNDPLNFGYNSAEQENSVLCIFYFQGPKQSQMELEFQDVNISSREASGVLGPHEMGKEAQKRACGVPRKGGRATLSLLPLGRPFRLIDLLLTIFV